MVVLTDGHTDWPSAAPTFPTIVLVLEHPQARAPQPPSWAQTIRVDPLGTLAPTS